MSQSKTNARHGSFALPIAIMFALFFMIAFVTGYQNPLGDVIKKMSAGNAVMSQLGTFCNFIAYAIMGYPAGKVLQNKGYRFTALAAVTVGFLGVAITYVSGTIADADFALVIYMLGALVAGFSMCMLNTVVNPMLNSLGKDEKQGNQLLMFGGSCNSVGATLAPVIVGGLIGGTASSIASANPVFYMAMAIFAVAFLVLFFSKLPEDPELGKKHAPIKAMDAFKFRNFTFGVLAIFCYMGIEIGVSNWTYQDLSTTIGSIGAGAVCGMFWLFMLVGRLLGGVVGGKVSSKAMLVFVSALAIVLLALGILLPTSKMGFFGFDSNNLSFTSVEIPVNSIFFVLVGLCTSVMWGAIFNLSVQGLGKYTSVASGIFMVMVCGGGIWTIVQGALADSVGIVNSFWLVICFAAYLLLYAVVLSKPVSSLPEEKEVLYEDGQKAEL